LGVKYYGQVRCCEIKTSLHTLIMSGQHTLKAALIFALCFIHAQTTPCGTNLDCKCWPEARIVSCANRGLEKVPRVSRSYRNSATILVLDGNQLTRLIGLNLDEWPSLESLWIRTNPIKLCNNIRAFKNRYIGRTIEIVADCTGDEVQEYDTDGNEDADHVENHGDYYENAEDTDERVGVRDPPSLPAPPQVPVPGPTYTRGLMERLMPTAEPTNNGIVFGEMTTASNNSETTDQGGMTVGVSLDMNGIVVTITVPLMFLGIAAVVVRIGWRRRQARQLEFGIEMTPVVNPTRTHLKVSPTPSEDSTTSTSSMAIFDAECDRRRRHDTRANRRLAMLASRGSE